MYRGFSMGECRYGKTDLIEFICEDTEVREFGITSVEVSLVVTKFLQALKNSIEGMDNGNTVELRGFGSFGVKLKKPRVARNPRTNQPVKIPAQKHVFFKTGIEIRTIFKNKTK